MAKEIIAPDHIGDGVYIHDNGFGIDLAVNHHENKVIVMEPSVIRAFIRYCERANYLNQKS